MNQPGYNGWTNRDTWVINLWLNNDEYLYEAVLELLKSDDLGELKKILKFNVSNTEEIDFKKVNWSEIFDSLKEQI